MVQLVSHMTKYGNFPPPVKNNKLSESVLLVKEQIDSECGVFTKLKSPCNETTQFYQLLSVQDDEDVHLVKAGSTKKQR